MFIKVIPCEGMDESEAMQYAVSIFTGTHVDWRARKQGYNEGCTLIFNDNTVAWFYKTKTAYAVRFDKKGGC